MSIYWQKHFQTTEVTNNKNARNTIQDVTPSLRNE